MHWPHKRLGQAALAVAAAVLMLLAMSSWVLLRSINQLGRSTSPAAAPTWFLPGARDAKPHPANFIDEICPSPGKWRNRSRHLHDANHDLEMVWVATQGSASCNTEPRLPRTKALGSLVGMRARRPPLRILFVGDSTMVRLFQGFEDLCEGKMDMLAQEEGCGFLDFLARTESPRRAYHAVNRSLCCGKFDVDQLDTEDGGPRLCNSWGYGIGRRVRCTSTMLDLELVPITMCNDRLRQSALVAYRRPYTYDAMVVNCGLHGMPHKHGVGGHVADVRGYLDMTIHMARHVVWLTTSRTLNGERGLSFGCPAVFCSNEIKLMRRSISLHQVLIRKPNSRGRRPTRLYGCLEAMASLLVFALFRFSAPTRPLQLSPAVCMLT